MLRVLVVDDEKPAREVLEAYLGEREDVQVVGQAGDGLEALELARQLMPDLVLLDIEMPRLPGIEVAARLPPSCAVMFVTAYDRYAIRAFELHAADYILKPVMKERLFEALDRVSARLQVRSSAGGGQDIGELLEFFRARRRYVSQLTIRSDFEYLVVSVFDISCIRVEGGLVFVYAKGLKYLVDTPLKKLEERLDPEVFVRAHRSALVNRHHIKRILNPGRGRYALETSDRLVVPISRDYLAQVRAALGWDA